MRLVICEKPSVARDLARVLGAKTKKDGYHEGNGLRITWCVGHMVELEDPEHYNAAWKVWSLDTLPIIPDRFDTRLRKGVADQWKVLARLMREKDTADVVNACDAGREGELIFRYVYEMARCRLPALRLWVSSLTDTAIQDAWAHLAPAARYDDLADAARSRSEADWLVGYNATRALTCLARATINKLLSAGRVQTPTLAMIVSRDREIAEFVPETFWQVKANFLAAAAGADEKPAAWEARFFRPQVAADKPEKDAKGDEGEQHQVSHAERLPTEDAARAVATAAEGQVGTIGTAERKRTREFPPLLYDLTSLQRRANQLYGFSADHTLELAQALYERHKLISYPRTDARFLTPDQAPTLPGILQSLEQIGQDPQKPGPYTLFCQDILSRPLKPGKRVINAAEVGDHHAILPTGRAPSGALTLDEKRIFNLVARRLLAALSEDALFDVTTLIVDVAPKPGAPLPDGVAAPLRFRARGRICVQEGWRAVDPPGKSRQIELPAVAQGAPAKAESTRIDRGQTRPPLPHNDASLLQAMETAGKAVDTTGLDDVELQRAMRSCGLGTPATRAEVIKKLLLNQYIERKGKDLLATDLGRALIDTVPVEELKSAELTGRWEARLSAIAEGRERREVFMADVKAHLGGMIQALAAAAPPAGAHLARPEDNAGDVLGNCPLCGEPVRERKQRGVYACDKGRGCDFVIFMKMASRVIKPLQARQLLKDGRTPPLNGFKSKKTKKPFSAALKLGDGGKVEFDFAGIERQPAEGAPQKTDKKAADERPTERAPAKKPADRRGPPPPEPEEAPRAARPAAPPPASPEPGPATPVGMVCPACRKGTLIRGHAAWGCGRYKEGCTFRLNFEDRGRIVSEADAARYLQRLLAGEGARA